MKLRAGVLEMEEGLLEASAGMLELKIAVGF